MQPYTSTSEFRGILTIDGKLVSGPVRNQVDEVVDVNASDASGLTT